MSFKEYASKDYVLEKLASLGSPVTSWNDLTDKPFGRGDVLYNISSENVIETVDGYAKISNDPVDHEALSGRTYILYSEDGSVVYTGQFFGKFTYPDYPGVYAVEIKIGDVSSSIYVVAEDNTELFGSALSKGIWVDSSFVDPTEDGIYLTEIIDLDKTLDEKYIPETIARVTDILTSWNDLADKPFEDGRKIYEWIAGKEYPTVGEVVKISNDAPDMSAFVDGKIAIEVIVEGEAMVQEMPIEEDGIYELAPGAFVVMDAIIVITVDSLENNGLTLTKGIWTMDFAQLGVPYTRISISVKGALKTIEDKFIPSTIARVKDVESMLGQIVYVEWDVNNEYEIAPDPAGDALVKLSDEVPNPTDLTDASMFITYERDGEVKSETVDFPPNYIVTTDYGYILGSAENPGLYFITAESAVIAETTLTRGIWTQNLAKIQGYLSFKIYKNPVIPKIFTAQVGQTIVVKSVDENGKPTEWECVDMPTGGAGSGLPPVTEADNGKVLTVVNGVWTAVELPNAEEASF